jgi:thiosulfate/3-mercaptopyruvate sulfurtransferase
MPFSGPLVSAEHALAELGTSVVLDARAAPGARDAWRGGHAPGARFVDLERDLSEVGDPSRGGRHPLPAWTTWLERVGSWGIQPSTPVLIYDADNGGMAAARAWWMLRAIGHQSVAVVDGGWDALRRAGVRGDTADVQVREEPSPYPSTRAAWPVVEREQVEQIRMDPAWTLVDARAPDRYAGRTEPIDPVAGHIPGAVNVYWKSSIDAHGRFATENEIRQRLQKAVGDTPHDRIVCYCGSGVTACHLLLAMEACGLGEGRLYVGSWSEWCRTRPDAISSR